MSDKKITAIYEFEDGEQYMYREGEMPHGIRRNGRRPCKLYIDELCYTPHEQFMYINALHPTHGEYVSIYEPSGKYILVDSRPVELDYNQFTRELVITHNNSRIVYQEELDGPWMTKKEVMEVYPEYFI